MSNDFRKAFDDIVECPICMEKMRDTRTLPCSHTFCRECLEAHVQDSGRLIICPFCRNESQIPKGGVEKLPKNILIEKLLELNESLQGSQINRPAVVCICSGHNDALDKDIGCIGYCVECEQYLCRRCSKSHARKKATSHRVLPTGCPDHADKQLEFFCKTCKLSICSQCSSAKHKSHEFCSFNEYANFVEKTLESVKSKKDKEIKALKVTASSVELLEREVKALRKKVSRLHFLEDQFEKLKVKSSEADVLRGTLERVKSENSQVTQKLMMAKKHEIIELKKRVEDLEKQKSLSTTNSDYNFSSSGIGSCREMGPHVFKLSCRTCDLEMCLFCFSKSLRQENTERVIVSFFVILALLFLAYKYFF